MRSERNVRGFTGFLLAIVVVLSILLISNHRSNAFTAAARSELRQQINLANKEHIPLTSADLLGKPIPESENAAPLYITAGEKLDAELKKLKRPSSASLPGAPAETYGAAPYELPRRDQPGELHRCYLACTPALELYLRAAQLPGCDFHEDPANALFESNTNLIRMTAAATLVAGEAARLSDSGQAKEALSLLGSFAPVAEHAGTAPTSFHSLIAISINRINLDCAFKVLSEHGRQPGIPEATSHFLKALGPVPDLVRTAQGENLSQLYLIQPRFLVSDRPVSTGDKATDATAALLGGLARRPGMIDSWHAVQIQSTRELVATLRSMGDDWSGAERLVTAQYLKFVGAGDQLAYMREDNVSDMWRESIDKVALCVSQRRILAQAAATFDVWNKTGKVPEALPLNGPESRDPLGNRPFHYERLVSGFKIYGAGPYGVDHGGKAPTPTQRDQNYEVVFTYPAPAK